MSHYKVVAYATVKVEGWLNIPDMGIHLDPRREAYENIFDRLDVTLDDEPVTFTLEIESVEKETP